MEEENRQEVRKIGKYPHASVVLSIAAAIFMIGVFALLVMHADKLTQVLRERIEIRVYLERDTDETKRKTILTIISGMNILDRKRDNDGIRFLSKETAADEMIRETGEDFLELLGDNPLRDAYVLKMKDEYFEKSRLLRIKHRLEGVDGIFEVDFSENRINQINSNVRRLGMVILGFVIVLIITVIVMISGAIRLALYSQRFLIRSMQLVGATPFFIKKPFILRAALQGFLGALLACTGLLISLIYFNLRLEELSVLQDVGNLFILFVVLCLTGSLICALSARLAVSRFLKKSLDELY